MRLFPLEFLLAHLTLLLFLSLSAMLKNDCRRCRGEKAQERDRTADLVLTKDVLYRLSYLGSSRIQNAIGAGNGTRTRDPELGRLALYQLSYSRMMVERAGFEPTKPYGGRFTVCSLWPLGNLSIGVRKTTFENH
jgi:hypothetical protein